MRAAVERVQAVPAITAVVRGTPTVGLLPRELARFLDGRGVAKASARDLAPLMAQGRDGATTVAAAVVLAHRAGVAVLATGGIGGVHRGGGDDESADLLELSRTPIIVVCSGAKAILDLAATVERLETLGVTVVGYRTDRFPAFYSAATRLPVSVRVESALEVAAIFTAHRALGRPAAILVVQPPPPETSLAERTVKGAVKKGLQAAARAGVRGPAVTPFLLQAVEHATAGRSVAANLALLERNAALAGEIAAALRQTASSR